MARKIDNTKHWTDAELEGLERLTTPNSGQMVNLKWLERLQGIVSGLTMDTQEE